MQIHRWTWLGFSPDHCSVANLEFTVKNPLIVMMRKSDRIDQSVEPQA